MATSSSAATCKADTSPELHLTSPQAEHPQRIHRDARSRRDEASKTTRRDRRKDDARIDDNAKTFRTDESQVNPARRSRLDEAPPPCRVALSRSA